MRVRTALLVVLAAASAGAQPTKRKPPAPASTATSPTSFRAHVGTEYALRLVRSADPEERLRGIERIASIGTQEAVAGLVLALETFAPLRADTRALVETARALAPFADQERARTGLLTIVNTGNPAVAARSATSAARAHAGEDGDPVARAELARQIAALALARSRETRALDMLYAAARSNSSGQAAAILALSTYPPRDAGFFGSSGVALPVPLVRMLGHVGDLRVLDLLHSASRSSDTSIRCAAIVSIAELGDERAIGLARTAIAESDARLRAAAGEALVLLSAPERFKATSALLSDDATAAIGVQLAERVHDAEIVKLLAKRAASEDEELRFAAVRALGRSPERDAATVLASPPIMGDEKLAYHAALALARSPAPNAGPVLAGLLSSRVRSLAARAYVVRALQRGERIGAADEIVFAMASSKDPKERALGVFARIVLGESSVRDYANDKEPRVRRAAAVASLARPTEKGNEALLAQLVKEQDPITRQVLAIGLLSGDRGDRVTTTTLLDRAESGGADAPLATYVVARRADQKLAPKIERLLASKDAVIRAHAARGLGAAPLADATGRLAEAYRYETDAEVRRAIVAALAMRTVDANAASRKRTLEIAAQLDPDGVVRQTARRAQAGAAVTFGEPDVRETAWLQITLDGGAPPRTAYAGSLVRSDGLAVPLVFDEDGFALVPGVPPGEARLVLAPRLPSYEPASP